jgi:hypothetical protein
MPTTKKKADTKTVYQVRHSFNFRDGEGNETFFTRANEHRLAEVIGDAGLKPYIEAGSVIAMDVATSYRAPNEPAPKGEARDSTGTISEAVERGTLDASELPAATREALKIDAPDEDEAPQGRQTKSAKKR